MDEKKVEPLKVAGQDHGMDLSEFFKSVMKPFQIFHGMLSGIIVIAVLGGFFLGGLWIHDIRQDTKKTQQQFELLNKNVIAQNQQNLILKVVDANLKAPIEDKVRVANMIYNMCLLKKVPPSLVCAVIEHESGWNPGAVNGDSGASGLMQLIPRYAYPYLRAERLPDSIEQVMEPMNNVMIGISQLADHQRDHVARKRTKPDEWMMTLHTYAWGGVATSQLFGIKDQRVNVPNMAYPQQINQLIPKYKEKGLE